MISLIFNLSTMYQMLIIVSVILTLQVDLYHCQIITHKPIEITTVDLRLSENNPRHHTSQYKVSNSYGQTGPTVVLRRGEAFDIVVHLKQNFNKTHDRIRLEFGFGSNPQLDKKTLIYVPIEDDQRSVNSNFERWGARFLKIDGRHVHIRIELPTNTPIGVWEFKMSTKVAGSKILNGYIITEALYIIFNSWSQGDSVYLPRDDARHEYVLNEVGKIYIGSYQRPYGRVWTYGQFHSTVLPVVMYLLDKTRLDVEGRSDVVKVARAVSALVNSHDDNGLLVGNWSGNYGDGLAPWQWTGSGPIFDRYVNQGNRPVKFGQCWVFGGVTTTALRTLGIPARTISNFVSAHDTDLSLTIDKFVSERGSKIDGVNGDSIWNFHVWSDAWMARYDLPPGFGGWQAIDATPQETSMGVYQLGPASLEAIKQGKVAFAYDVGFVYSEVNADTIQWRLDPRLSGTSWRKDNIQIDHVGRKILTKAIGVLDERSRFGVADAEDIINQYKFVEGSAEERLSYAEATRYAGLRPILGGR